MMGVPAEVMKLVAALGRVEASTVFPRFAERRLTPTTVRASCFERSGDNRAAYAKRSAGPGTEMRGDGTFSRSDFAYDPEGNAYVCPGGKELKKYNRAFSKPRHGLTKDRTATPCTLKPKCSEHASARDRALRS